MGEDREPQDGTTESTERIPPGSMPPDDEAAGSDANDPNRVSKLPPDPTEEEKADEESKDSFPASDPPAW